MADADQVGPKFMYLFYLSYLRDKNILGCRMLSDDCNPALIDPIVASLQARGVKFRFNCHLRDILVKDGQCAGLVVSDFSDCDPVICGNCGLQFPAAVGAPKPVGSEIFCSVCGHSWRIDGYQPAGTREVLRADAYISALQPHQLAAIYREPDNHPLRYYPDFRRLAQFKGAVLTVSRLYLDRKIGDGSYNLTGLDRDFFSLNGAMDISTVMRRYLTSVLDTLSDDGEVLAAYPASALKARIYADLLRIFPEMASAKVTHHVLARIGPEVLYHRGVPRLNSRFLPKSPDTSLMNFYLAGDWTDELELGLEAAIKSGISAANAVLVGDGCSELEPLLWPTTAPLVRWMQRNWLSRLIRSHYEKRYARELPPRRG